MRQVVHAAGLEASSIVDAARAATGVPDSIAPRPEFLAALHRLTESIDAEAHLHDAGRATVRGALVTALATALRVEADAATHPRTAQVSFQPIFITGLYRSGTTFLQHLLSHHPQLRVPPLWELLAPASDEPEQHLIASARTYVNEYYRAAPRFRAIHELDPLLPEECHRLLGLSFANPIYGLRYRIPSYLSWLDRQPLAFTYAFHKLALQCVLRRRSGHKLVLKCPTHLWHLPALAEVYPAARVVVLHRSPSATLPSLCNLTAVVRAARAEKVDLHEIGEFWLARATRALERPPDNGRLSTPALHVRYADLVADPIATVARVCDYAGVELTEAVRSRMRHYVDNQERVREAHTYQAEDFGLTSGLLEARFGEYIARHSL